jgi:hypothetical protein
VQKSATDIGAPPSNDRNMRVPRYHGHAGSIIKAVHEKALNSLIGMRIYVRVRHISSRRHRSWLFWTRC